MTLPSSSSRRAILRAGVTTAWTVPAVTLASAAPAHAVSAMADMSVPTLGAVRTLVPLSTALKRLVVTSTLTNSGGASTTALTLVVDLVNRETTFGYANSAPVITPDGWTYTGKEVYGDHDDVRMFYAATVQLGAGASTSFNPVIDLAYTNFGTITMTALPGGAGATGSNSFDFA